MTVPAFTSAVATGNGVTTVFPYTFEIPTGMAKVTIYNPSTFTETVLTEGVDYSVSAYDDPAGGNVTYPLSGSPLASPNQIVISRTITQVQTLDLNNQSSFQPTTLETTLDRIVMMVQELDATKIDMPAGSGIDAADVLTASATASTAATTASAAAVSAAASAADAAASAGAVTPVETQINAAADNAPTDDDFFGYRDTGTGALFKRTWGDLKTLLASTFVALTNVASSANFLANAASKVLDTSGVWGASALVSLTDAATIAVDMSTFINATVTLGGNRTLGAPTNTKVGQSGVIYVVQDGTGSRTLAYNSAYKFANGTAPTLSTAAGSVDRLTYFVRSSTHIDLDISKARA